MNSRTAIITAANTGLGLECGRALLASDPSWHVILAVRNPARGTDAVTELDRRLGHGAQGVAVNAFDAGLMPGSGLARDYPSWLRMVWRSTTGRPVKGF
ncbi:NAD(P)-dependent dehydrogenase (short-subunit alcohol dehydrogenase family) [Mycobacterium sp. URHB0021]